MQIALGAPGGPIGLGGLSAMVPSVSGTLRLGVPVVTLLLGGLGSDILTNATAQAAVLAQLRANVQAAVGNIPFNITLQPFSGSGSRRRLLTETAELSHEAQMLGTEPRVAHGHARSARALGQDLASAALGPSIPGMTASGALTISNVAVSDIPGGAPTASAGAGSQLIAVITFPASTAADQQSFVSAQQLADNIQANPALVLSGPLLAAAQVQVVVLRLEPSPVAGVDESEAPSAAVQRAGTPTGSPTRTAPPPPPPPCDPSCTLSPSPTGRRLQHWLPRATHSRRLQSSACCPVSSPVPSLHSLHEPQQDLQAGLQALSDVFHHASLLVFFILCQPASGMPALQPQYCIHALVLRA